MTDRYVYTPRTPLGVFEVDAVASSEGQYELGRMASEFSSVVDLLHHTTSFGHGSGTLVNMPDGNNIELVNIPKREFAHGISDIAAAYGFPHG